MESKTYKRLLAAALSSLTLAGCSSVNSKKVSGREICDGLSSKEDLTDLDEHLNTLKAGPYYYVQGEDLKLELVDNRYDFKIEELEEEINKDEDACDIAKCNELLEVTIYEIIKTEIAESLGKEYDDIEVRIDGNRYDPSIEDSTVSLYSVNISIGDKQYKYEGKDKARELFYYYRAASKQQLEYNELKECYNYIKKAMMLKVKTKDKEITHKGTAYSDYKTDRFGQRIREKVEYKFDGYIDLVKDKEKQEAVKTYIKTQK